MRSGLQVLNLPQGSFHPGSCCANTISLLHRIRISPLISVLQRPKLSVEPTLALRWNRPRPLNSEPMPSQNSNGLPLYLG